MFKKITNLIILFISVAILIFIVNVFYNVFSKKTVEQTKKNQTSSVSGEIINTNTSSTPNSEATLGNTPPTNGASEITANHRTNNDTANNELPSPQASSNNSQNSGQLLQENPDLQNALPPIPSAPPPNNSLESASNVTHAITFPINNSVGNSAQHTSPSNSTSEENFPLPAEDSHFPAPSNAAESNFPTPIH